MVSFFMMLPRPRSELGDLIISWVLVSVPLTIGFLMFFTEGMKNGDTHPGSIKVGLFWALVMTLILGTFGYGFIRSIQTRYNGHQSWLDRVLLGQDRQEAKRWTARAVLSFILVFLFLVVRHPARVVSRQQTLPPSLGLGIGALLVYGVLFTSFVAVRVYRNDGLLVGWIIVSAPIAAITVFTALPVTRLLHGSITEIAMTFGLPLLSGALFGTLGFFLGVGTRRLLRLQTVSTSLS